MSNVYVKPYSPSELGKLFDQYSHKGEGQSAVRSHLRYFSSYFRDLSAATIVVESEYTDKDYTEDFAAYYVRCHDGYGKICARLHFFDFDFDDKFFKGCLDRINESIEKLQKGYLGFIVIRPLPSTIIGRTCLQTYGNRGQRSREFPATCKYEAHVCGIDLTVESVPFQEQDIDVAACATSALWSALNCTGRLFQHHIPTPAEITEAAAIHQRPFGRALPAANGLSSAQMADALAGQGLEPLLLNAKDLDFLRIAVCAYLRARIPPVLIGQLDRGTTPLGGHAIAVMGYSSPISAPHPYGPTGCLFRSTSIEVLYAHDDQVGPFARMPFTPGSPTIGTSWFDNATPPTYSVVFRPEMLIMPLYHKIRVPVDAMMKAVRAIDDWLEMARGQLVPLPQRLEWDLSLNNVAQFKASIFKDTNVHPDFRLQMLIANCPRYIWRAEAFCNGMKQFELCYDATDLLQGNHFIFGLPYAPNVCRAIGIFTQDQAIQNYIQSAGPRSAAQAASWFAKEVHQF